MNLLLLLIVVSIWMVVEAQPNITDIVQSNKTHRLLSYDMMDPSSDESSAEDEAMKKEMAMLHEKKKAMDDLFKEAFTEKGIKEITMQYEAWKAERYGAGVAKKHSKAAWVGENLLDLSVNFVAGGSVLGATFETVSAAVLAKRIEMNEEEEPEAHLKKHSDEIKRPLARFGSVLLKEAVMGGTTGSAAGATSGALFGTAAGVIFPPTIAISGLGGLAGGAVVGGIVGFTWGGIKGGVKGTYMLIRDKKKGKALGKRMKTEYKAEYDFFEWEDLTLADKKKLLFTLDTIAEKKEHKAASKEVVPGDVSEVEAEIDNSLALIDPDVSGGDKAGPVLPVLKRIGFKEEFEFLSVWEPVTESSTDIPWEPYKEIPSLRLLPERDIKRVFIKLPHKDVDELIKRGTSATASHAKLSKLLPAPAAKDAKHPKHPAQHQYFNEYPNYDFYSYRYQEKANDNLYQSTNINMMVDMMMIIFVLVSCGIMIGIGAVCITSIGAALCYVWNKIEGKSNQTTNEMYSV